MKYMKLTCSELGLASESRPWATRELNKPESAPPAGGFGAPRGKWGICFMDNDEGGGPGGRGGKPTPWNGIEDCMPWTGFKEAPPEMSNLWGAYPRRIIGWIAECDICGTIFGLTSWGSEKWGGNLAVWIGLGICWLETNPKCWLSIWGSWFGTLFSFGAEFPVFNVSNWLLICFLKGGTDFQDPFDDGIEALGFIGLRHNGFSPRCCVLAPGKLCRVAQGWLWERFHDSCGWWGTAMSDGSLWNPLILRFNPWSDCRKTKITFYA